MRCEEAAGQGHTTNRAVLSSARYYHEWARANAKLKPCMMLRDYDDVDDEKFSAAILS